jgi:hypothetical protein
MEGNYLFSLGNMLAVGTYQLPHQENQGLFLLKKIGQAVRLITHLHQVQI